MLKLVSKVMSWRAKLWSKVLWKWKWLGFAPFVLAAMVVGAGLAFGLGLGFGPGLVGGLAATILVAIADRIRGGYWYYIPMDLLAPALIGESLGAGLALVFGFNIGLGIVGGCIGVTVLVPLLSALFHWYGEGLALASFVVESVPLAGVIGAGLAIILGFDVLHGAAGGGSVASILGLWLWLQGFRDQSKRVKTRGAKGDESPTRE